MFDVGFAELFLLALIGLLVLGPERLPAVARTLGGFLRKARMSYHNLKRTVEAELAAAEAANPVNEAKRELESVQEQVKALGESLDEKIDDVKRLEQATAPNEDDLNAADLDTDDLNADTVNDDESNPDEPDARRDPAADENRQAERGR